MKASPKHAQEVEEQEVWSTLGAADPPRTGLQKGVVGSASVPIQGHDHVMSRLPLRWSVDGRKEGPE